MHDFCAHLTTESKTTITHHPIFETVNFTLKKTWRNANFSLHENQSKRKCQFSSTQQHVNIKHERHWTVNARVVCKPLTTDSVHFIQQNGKPKFSQKDVSFETGSTAPEWNLIEMTRRWFTWRSKWWLWNWASRKFSFPDLAFKLQMMVLRVVQFIAGNDQLGGSLKQFLALHRSLMELPSETKDVLAIFTASSNRRRRSGILRQHRRLRLYWSSQ